MSGDCDEVRERLKDLVLVEDRIVTFNYLSEAFSISAKEAQDVMIKFVEQMEKDGRKEEIVASYILSGYGKEDKQEDDAGVIRILKLMRVDESDIGSYREMYFGEKTGLTIKSIREKNATMYAELDKKTDESMQDDEMDGRTNGNEEVSEEPDCKKSDANSCPSQGKKQTLSDDDDMDFKPLVTSQSVPKENGTSKKENKDSDDDEMEFKPTVAKKPAPKKKVTNSRAVSKKLVVQEVSDDEEEDDEEMISRKTRKRVRVFSDSESDEDEKPLRKTKREQETESSEEEEGNGDVVIVKKTDKKTAAESKKAKAAMARLQKEEEQERRKNGKVVAKEVAEEEMVEVEEEFEDEDGFKQTKLTKKLQPIAPEVLKARKEAMNGSQSSSSASQKSSKSQSSGKQANGKSKTSTAKGKQAAPQSKKITDFFRKS